MITIIFKDCRNALAGAAALLLAFGTPGQATTAYLLDTAGLGNIDELYLVGTLQGVVNRDAPLLFLTNVAASNCNGAGNTYVNYLQSQKGFTFIQLRSLNDAVATFASLKRADGVTPLIKGMIKYQTTYPRACPVGWREGVKMVSG